MCLTEREQQIKKLMDQQKSADTIAKETGLKLSSVKTYMARVKNKTGATTESNARRSVKDIVKAAVAKAVSGTVRAVEETKKATTLRRCSSFTEFQRMMQEVPVTGKTLEERVVEFKDVYCKVCIYPSRCNQCPTKILMDKYLQT